MQELKLTFIYRDGTWDMITKTDNISFEEAKKALKILHDEVNRLFESETQCPFYGNLNLNENVQA